MSSNRRASTIQEIQKRQRLQPVPNWVQQWVKPQNSLPGSTYKVLKWVKTEQKQYFSDDEDDVAEAAVAVVVDEEVDDSRMASELPGDAAALADDDADDDDADDVAPTPAEGAGSAVLTEETAAALKSMDNLTEVAEAIEIQKKLSPQASTHLPLAPLSTSAAFPDLEAGTPMSNSALDDITAEEIDALIPSGPIDLPEPADDGPDLADITREQLIEDADVFDSAPAGMVAPDGIMESDSGMEYVIGEP